MVMNLADEWVLLDGLICKCCMTTTMPNWIRFEDHPMVWSYQTITLIYGKLIQFFFSLLTIITWGLHSLTLEPGMLTDESEMRFLWWIMEGSMKRSRLATAKRIQVIWFWLLRLPYRRYISFYSDSRSGDAPIVILRQDARNSSLFSDWFRWLFRSKADWCSSKSSRSWFFDCKFQQASICKYKFCSFSVMRLVAKICFCWSDHLKGEIKEWCVVELDQILLVHSWASDP